jgi:1,4-alpha-glucan branching enzyme
VKDHLLRFLAIHDQVLAGHVDGAWLQTIEDQDNLFPHLDYRHWL